MWRTQAAVFCIIYVHPPPWPPPPRYINIRHTLLTCTGHKSWCGIGDSNKLHMWFSDIHPLCSDWPSLPKYQIFSCLFKGVCVCVFPFIVWFKQASEIITVVYSSGWSGQWPHREAGVAGCSVRIYFTPRPRCCCPSGSRGPMHYGVTFISIHNLHNPATGLWHFTSLSPRYIWCSVSDTGPVWKGRRLRMN